MPWRPRVPTRWPSWNVPIFALCSVAQGIGLLVSTDAYTSGTYTVAHRTLGLHFWGVVLIVAGVLALTFVNELVAAVLVAALTSWLLMIVAALLTGDAETGPPVWLVGIVVAVISGVGRRGTRPR